MKIDMPLNQKLYISKIMRCFLFSSIALNMVLLNLITKKKKKSTLNSIFGYLDIYIYIYIYIVYIYIYIYIYLFIIRNNPLQTVLYPKPMVKYDTLYFKSSHSKHLKEVFSQALKIRRIGLNNYDLIIN